MLKNDAFLIKITRVIGYIIIWVIIILAKIGRIKKYPPINIIIPLFNFFTHSANKIWNISFGSGLSAPLSESAFSFRVYGEYCK